MKAQLFTLFSVTLMALGVFIVILFNQDPDLADPLTKIVFFSSMFVSILGILSFANFYIRVYLTNREIIYAHLPIAIRQAVIISLLITGLFVMQTLKVLTVMVAIMYILALVLVELFFNTRKYKINL